METCKLCFCYRWIIRCCVWKRRLVLRLSFRMRSEYFSRISDLWSAFPDLTAFIVLSEKPLVVQANFTSTPNASAIASTPNASTVTTRTSRNLSRRALACAKIVRADLDNNGKPSNLRLHNHTFHVIIYSEEQACVTYLLHKIREEMVERDLVFVGSSGLVIYDQARGKLLVSFFVTLFRGVKTFCPLKLTSQGFGSFFFKKTFFATGSRSCYSLLV